MLKYSSLIKITFLSYLLLIFMYILNKKTFHYLFTVLKQLEIERQQKSQHPGVTEPNEKKPENIEMSPFKKFQGNIFDKVKQIANPSVLVDKVQEKLNVEKKTESTGMTGTSRQTSESGSTQHEDLPPVIQLDSPDLMTIEIGQMALEDSSPERIDGAIGSDVNQSDRQRTGSGAFSALARLQEDHLTEENSDPVYRIANHSEETPSIRISGEIEPDGDDIVFKRKVKKKKKKGKLFTFFLQFKVLSVCRNFFSKVINDISYD